jgi:Uma2 family endonuclease
MGEPARRDANYADLETVPDHLVAEILGGELVTHPRPAPKHSVSAGSLADELISPFQKSRGGPGGWLFMPEPELHLGRDVVVPDLAAWRVERLPELPLTAWIETPPDWLCEVLSPSTERHDRNIKLKIYARTGIPHIWYVEPRTRTLEVFELKERKWLLFGTFQDAEPVTAPPFLELTFDLSVLWPYDKVGRA